MDTPNFSCLRDTQVNLFSCKMDVCVERAATYLKVDIMNIRTLMGAMGEDKNTPLTDTSIEPMY